MIASDLVRQERPALQRLSKALEALQSDESGVVEDLERLLACDTSFPPGSGYVAFADLVEGKVAPLGFEARRVIVPRELWDAGDGAAFGERVNLLAARRMGRPVCSLYFHVDVVPPGDGWTRPPLALTVEGRTLYGRGTADMKGTIAATLAAFRAADRVGLPLAFDPVLLFCTDEEGGLYPGIRYLAEQNLVEGHLLSFNGGAAPRIWAGCFGSVDLLVEIEGRAAHSGDPGNGVNAIETAVPLLVALQGLKHRVESRKSAMPSPPHFEGRPLTSRLTITAAHGGTKGSSLPGRFTLTINRRYAPEEKSEDVLRELEETIAAPLKSSGALSFSSRIVGHLAPVSDPVGPHWPRWQAALSEGFGWTPEEFRAWGSSTSSDMGWVQQAGIKEILLGGLTRPGCGAHGADEHTTLDDVLSLAKSILLYFAADFHRATSPTQSQREHHE
jgi:succinyl-diaminopimelate desuccinylase